MTCSYVSTKRSSTYIVSSNLQIMEDLFQKLEKIERIVKRRRVQNMELLLEREKLIVEKVNENKKLGFEIEKLKQELAVATQKLRSDRGCVEENVHRLDQEENWLSMEDDQDRGDYEKLLKDYQDLEEYSKKFERKLDMYVQRHCRSFDNTSSSSEAIIQHEIARMRLKTLDLQEKYDKVAAECDKLRKRLRDAGLSDTVEPIVNQPLQASQSTTKTIMPAIHEKARDYEGMIEFQKKDITAIIRHLVIELKPKIAVTLLPGLPAYIIFMCIRHTDWINDDKKVRSLLTGYLNAVKHVIKKRDDFDSAVLWLSNTLRLLHNIKQYSGDRPFQVENTPRQNEQCLWNFDLSEYRSVLSNVGVWIFSNIMTILKEKIEALIVPALLEHQAITAWDSNKSRENRFLLIIESMHKFLDELNSIHNTLQFHGVDTQIIAQVFKQLFYFMCASALNNLLMRNELCHWTKGMQIRYHLSHLEQWAQDEGLSSAAEALQPLIQATELLQARKTNTNVKSVCEMCNKLSAHQVLKILHLYTPADEFETRVPMSFIKNVQAVLKQRQGNNDQLLMDLNFSDPMKIPFNPSNTRLEDIEIPPALNLFMLKKV